MGLWSALCPVGEEMASTQTVTWRLRIAGRKSYHRHPPAKCCLMCRELSRLRRRLQPVLGSRLFIPCLKRNLLRRKHVLTPVPPAFLKHSRVFVKGEMELPVWGMLDYTAGGDDDEWKNGVAGVEWGRVPYLQWGKGEGAG